MIAAYLCDLTISSLTYLQDAFWFITDHEHVLTILIFDLKACTFVHTICLQLSCDCLFSSMWLQDILKWDPDHFQMERSSPIWRSEATYNQSSSIKEKIKIVKTTILITVIAWLDAWMQIAFWMVMATWMLTAIGSLTWL